MVDTNQESLKNKTETGVVVEDYDSGSFSGRPYNAVLSYSTTLIHFVPLSKLA